MGDNMNLQIKGVTQIILSTDEQIVRDIFAEIDQSILQHGDFPKDMIHAAAIVSEESGELIQAAIDYEFNPEKRIDDEIAWSMYREAIQTAAMGIKFIQNMKARGLI